MMREDSIEGLRRRAQRRLPRMVFDFIDGGAESEETLRRNTQALARLALVPNCFAGAEPRDLSMPILGRAATMPLVIAPTGLAALVWPRADELLAQAAERAGIPFIVSTSSSASLEEIADAAPAARLWMQIYPYKDRELVKSLIRRAASRGFEALVLTVDTPVLGHRVRDHANHFTVPLRVRPALLREVLCCPAWTWGILRHGIPRMRNLMDYGGGHGLESLAQLINRNLNPGANWEDLAWIREVWRGRLILKGVLSPAGAERAVREGLDAIVVSNHGGRQLDSAPATVTMLPQIIEAVGNRVEVYVDGGIRSGTDIAKVVALGACSAMIGRAALYGVGAAGGEGAAHVLKVLRAQYDRTLALLGCRSSTALAAIKVMRS